jgi:hypothetical protein
MALQEAAAITTTAWENIVWRINWKLCRSAYSNRKQNLITYFFSFLTLCASFSRSLLHQLILSTPSRMQTINGIHLLYFLYMRRLPSTSDYCPMTVRWGFFDILSYHYFDSIRVTFSLMNPIFQSTILIHWNIRVSHNWIISRLCQTIVIFATFF